MEWKGWHIDGILPGTSSLVVSFSVVITFISAVYFQTIIFSAKCLQVRYFDKNHIIMIQVKAAEPTDGKSRLHYEFNSMHVLM